MSEGLFYWLNKYLMKKLCTTLITRTRDASASKKPKTPSRIGLKENPQKPKNRKLKKSENAPWRYAEQEKSKISHSSCFCSASHHFHLLWPFPSFPSFSSFSSSHHFHLLLFPSSYQASHHFHLRWPSSYQLKFVIYSRPRFLFSVSIRVFNSLAPWLQLDSLCFLFSFAFLISPFWHQQPIILNFCPSVISKENSLDGGWFWSLGASIGTQLFLKQIMWATKQTKQTLWAQSDKHSYDTVTLPHLIFWNIKSIRPIRELHHEFLN